MKILLTGATSGIGYETLKMLVKNGDYVYAVGRDFTKIEKFVEENKSKIQTFNFDFKNVDKIADLFLSFNLDNIKFHGLVHCAGIEETIPLSLYTPEKVKNIFDINVLSGVELLRHFSKKKFSNDGASLIYLSSVMGVLGQPGKIGYCATKAAILGFVKASALELAKRKIRVNAVLPGIVNTPLTQKLFDQLDNDNITKIKDMHPLGIGEVQDIAPMILFLLSDHARWITGQGFIIDGGYSSH